MAAGRRCACWRTIRTRWDAGGFGIWLGSYVDMFYLEEANAKVRRFLHDKIREKVDDPEEYKGERLPDAPEKD